MTRVAEAKFILNFRNWGRILDRELLGLRVEDRRASVRNPNAILAIAIDSRNRLFNCGNGPGLAGRKQIMGLQLDCPCVDVVPRTEDRNATRMRRLQLLGAVSRSPGNPNFERPYLWSN